MMFAEFDVENGCNQPHLLSSDSLELQLLQFLTKVRDFLSTAFLEHRAKSQSLFASIQQLLVCLMCLFISVYLCWFYLCLVAFVVFFCLFPFASFKQPTTAV